MTTAHRVATSAAALVLSVVLGAGVLAQAPATVPQSPAQQASDGGQNDGIRVHGHWTIEIRNPDGTLASRTEFENALISGAADVLATFLVRTATPGTWDIALISPGTTGLCDNDGRPTGCIISDPASPLSASYLLKNLVVSRTPSSGFRLRGSATAFYAASINQVATDVGECQANVAPNACFEGNDFQFTYHDLSPAIPVQAGQIIQVTVDISFS